MHIHINGTLIVEMQNMSLEIRIRGMFRNTLIGNLTLGFGRQQDNSTCSILIVFCLLAIKGINVLYQS